MDKTLFEELVGSLKEAKAIAKGRAKPSRRFEVTAPDAKAVREQTGLSQGDFAKLMRVSEKTLQRLGDTKVPGEPERTTALRASLFDALARFGNDEGRRAHRGPRGEAHHQRAYRRGTGLRHGQGAGRPPDRGL